MNRVFLYGHLGADPELRATSRGTSALKFSLATNERVKKGEQWEDHTEWHRVIVWGKRAESLSTMLAKGSAVLVEGCIRTTKYEKDGSTRYSTEINANEVRLAGRREGGDGGGSQPRRGGDRQQQRPKARGDDASVGDGDGYEAPAEGPSYDDDDIPF